jgi:chlorite dismutase
MAVLIPIGKSEEWWKLAQDQRQAYFQKTDTHQGHTAIGLKYVDRVFRKLYHSRYLNAALGYDFLTYFEFEDVYEKDFKDLLAELRDTSGNPEWAYVNLEFEIWMTKIA